ncbi:MAG: threonylcarbamoyl-AMP synthase [Chthoniobacterales bacterium]|nr:threonylcarbamoyl-AMP synthase [Chthoniobacterales bacterium]
MTTRVIPAQSATEVAAAAREAADLLRQGQCAALPTETVYGLACDALNARAATGVFAVKERPAFDPLIVHVAGTPWIERLTAAQGTVLALAQRLAEEFWPGPLTMVLPAAEEGDEVAVPDLVRSGLPTVALRSSAHPVMRAVIESLGGPVAAPSANRFGRISPVAAQHVLEELDGRIPLVVDGGPCRHGLESTIVQVEDGRLVLLRPGPVTREDLERFAPVERATGKTPVAAPGMLESHYAPRTPLKILGEQEGLPADAGESGLLAFGSGGGFAVVEELPSDPVAAAPLFFSALRRLDASDVRRIYARPIPESGLGMALMDRLRRAAHD